MPFKRKWLVNQAAQGQSDRLPPIKDRALDIRGKDTDVTRGRYAHPHENRAITLREAARLQTFPDDYMFAGSRSQIAEQIGNAVPVELARRLIIGLTSSGSRIASA